MLTQLQQKDNTPEGNCEFICTDAQLQEVDICTACSEPEKCPAVIVDSECLVPDDISECWTDTRVIACVAKGFNQSTPAFAPGGTHCRDETARLSLRCIFFV